MAPLILLLVALFSLRAFGIAVPAFADWQTDGRYALALMLVFTASAHFVPSTRQDLLRTVPSRLPLRSELLSLTGVLELLAAAGLVVPWTAPLAGLGLVLLLLALFPANIKAAVDSLPLRGKPATPLALRLPLQILFIGVAWWASQPGSLLTL